MKPVRITTISDIHLGHHKVPAPVIIANARRYLFPKIPETDILIIGGDVTDTAIEFGHIYAQDIIAFLIDLLALCAEHDVVVRVMRGTFSHDRTQLETLVTYQEKHGFKNDFRYIDTICLEHIPRYDIRFLFLPDDLPYASSDAVMDVVHEQMTEKNWTTVHYAFTHGYFEDVVPAMSAHHGIVYRREQFRFVIRKVVSGHVHTHSVHEDLLYNGSFDRTAQGEEEAKGFLYFDDGGIDDSGKKDLRIEFVENKTATPFVTWDLRDLRTSEEVTATFRSRMDFWKPGGIVDPEVRVVYDNNDVLRALGKIAKSEYPHVRYTSKTVLEAAPKVDAVAESLGVKTLIPPTPDNLPAMIVDFHARKKTPLLLTEDHVRQLLINLKGKTT